jgi:hypothetical protein
MPDPVLRVAAFGLAATFAWAALAKVLRRARWRTALSAYELPGALRAIAAPTVPAAEGAIATALFVGATRVGAAASVALLATFSGALLYARERRGDRLPCGCFGRATDRDYRVLLARNALLGVLAAVLLVSGRNVTLSAGWSLPSGGEVVPALLVAAGIAVVAWMVWQVSSSLGERGRR